VLDYEQLTLLEGLGSRSDFMERLIGVFVKDSGTLMDKMDAALEGRRFGELRSLVHSLRGSAGSIGAQRLMRACGEIQECAEGGCGYAEAASPGTARGPRSNADRLRLPESAKFRG
jgi:HPt (histidine-containing phosphotransfer) domain-containing protein